MRQKPVWTVEEIREILRSGIDRDRLDSLHAQAMYSLTGMVKNHSSWRVTGSGLWPVYQDYVPTKVETGNSRKILNSSRILLSQFSGVVEPETRFVDKDTNQLRKECWRVRSAGDGMGDGGWDLEMASQYTAFRELGTGCVFHDELTLDPNDDKSPEYATLKYFKATDVVYDRNVRNPLHAKWVCRRTPFSKFEAIEMFGADKVGPYDLLPGGSGYPLEVVWLYEFFSVPFAGRRETYCAFIGSVEGGNVFKSPRTARCPYLPCSWGVNFLPEGSRWPLGGAWLQAATQGLMNNLEAKFRKASDRQSMTAVDLRAVKGKNLVKGQETGWLELSLAEQGGSDPDIRKAIQHMPGASIEPSDIELYSMAERQYNEDAGLTEQMRGNVSAQDRTLGEQEMAQAGAEQSQTYEKVQALAMTKRVVEKTFDRMKRFDRAPVFADMEGFDIVLNDPDDRDTWLDQVFAKTGVIRIDPGSITMDGDRAKMARRVAELADPNLVALVGMPGGINPEWYRDELMKAHGEDDPHEYGMPAQAMGGLGDALTQMATMGANKGTQGKAGMPAMQPG